MTNALLKTAPYLVTTACVLAVSLFKFVLLHYANVDSPVLLYFSAIAFAAWYGGLRQGVLATLLSMAAVVGYIAKLTHVTISQDVWAIRLGMLAVDGIVVSLMSAKIHRESARASLASQEAVVNSRRFQKIFGSDMIGMFFSDAEGTIQEANDYFLSLLGYTREDLKAGKLSWKNLTSPETMQAGLDAQKIALSQGTVRPFEQEYVKANGERIACSVAATLINEDQVVAFVLDITASKRAQLAQLSQSQVFLDSVVENIPNMIFVKDAVDLRFVRFNRAGEKLLGLDSDHLLGRNDFDLFPTEQAEIFIRADRQALDGGKAVDIPEEPIQTPDGIRLLHTKKIPILDAEGRPQYLLGISEDITEKRKSERQKIELMASEMALSEAERTARRLRFLSEASAALNRSLDIHAMLGSFARVLIREMASTCVIDILDDSGSTFDRLAITRGRRSGESTIVDSHIVVDFLKCKIDPAMPVGPMPTLRTGQPQIYRHLDDASLQTALTPCAEQGAQLNRDGVTSMLIVPILYHTKILGSITLLAPEAKVEFDELDMSVAQDLAKRAAFAIENAALYSRASEASRTKSAFLANISHEIRTPLGAMIGFAELSLGEQNLSSGENEYIQKILKNGQQLLRIVNDVLDISKVESDRLQIDRVDFSLPRLLEDIVSLLQTQAENKGLQLTLHKATDLPVMISTDPLRLRQILINMIGNAIKFTEKGRVEVAVEVATNPVAGDGPARLSFLIKDTGLGIDDEQAARLFEPFVQADESMTRKFGGTGLGLYLSRKLARLLGGDVKLQSSLLGQGSVFRVDIEVQMAEPALVTAAAVPPPKAARDLTTQLQGRILVVEDSIDNQILIQAFLQNEALSIDVADNGLEGVSKANEKNYDLILMDIQMPIMDGFEAIQLLRSKGYRGHVVALTAHGMKGDRERCLEQGFDDYLCKPISRQSLVECVSKNLNVGSH
jgi:PAS domain S-box-containing protein